MADIVNNSAPAPTETPLTDAQVQDGAVDAADEAIETPTVAEIKEEIKKLGKKKLALKVDGKDEEMELDLDNEDELRKHLQLSKVAQKRMQEKSEYEKNVKNFFDKLMADPAAVLSNPGLLGKEKLKELAAAIMNEEIEDMKKSPEQKEKEALQKKLQELEEERTREKKAREEAEFARLQEQAAVQYEQGIMGALEGAGLPKSPYTVHKMAQAMMLALENGIELSPQDVVPLIKKQVTQDIRELMGVMPEDAIEDFIGKDVLTKVRKRQLAKMKQPANPAAIKATGASEKAKEEKVIEKVPAKDFFKRLGKF